MIGQARGELLPYGSPPVATITAKPLDAKVDRKPRRRSEGSGLSTALPATFIGMLLVHALRPAESQAATDEGGHAAAPVPGHPHVEPAAMQAVSMAALPAFVGTDHATTVPGSVLAAGSLIDPSALTQLSGSAHFGELAARPLDAIDTVQEVGAAHGPVEVTAAPVDVSVEATTQLYTISTGTEDTGDTGDGGTDPGPIGDYHPPVPDGGGTDTAILGTDANDVMLGGDGNDVMRGLAGDDRIEGGGGDDQLDGGAGNDTLLGQAGGDTLQGGEGNDHLEGGDGDDTLQGGDGDDTLLGGAGHDQLDGGAGRDVMQGGAGDDTYTVDDPYDLAQEPTGVDGGNDTVVIAKDYADNLLDLSPLKAPHGEATFLMGQVDAKTYPAGLDAYRQQLDPNIENIRLEGTAPHDVVAGGDHANLIDGNDGDNRLYAGAGDDILHGGGGADHLYGQVGADHLFGGAGDDWLDGGDGADWLDGGDGHDMLYGGAGDDTFFIGLHEDAATVFDHEGHNLIKVDGADAGKLGAVLSGDNLELSYDGTRIATVDGWATHKDAFTGVEAGGQLRTLDSLLDPAPAVAAKAAGGDWLAHYLDPTSTAVTAKAAAASPAEGQHGESAAATAAAASLGSWVAGPLDHGFATDHAEQQDEHHKLHG